MSFLFGSSQKQEAAQAPAPVPESPDTSEAARMARENAERAAVANAKSAGRASTIVAGQQIAMDEQMLRVSKRKAASSAILG